MGLARFLTCAAGFALSFPFSATAQEAVPPAAAGARTYTPADFARFAPKTALDMVRQIPGFSLEETEEKRGLGQGGNNVLINGQRFSGKSNDAIAALGRIGAASVTRIEVLEGATLDIPGLTGQVVNIVGSIGAGAGQFRWSPQVRVKRTDPQLLDGEISWSGKTGRIDYTLSVSNDSFRNGNAGLETVLDGAGQNTDLRPEVLFVDSDTPRLAGSFKHESEAGSVANLNVSYERFYNTVIEDSDRIDRTRDYYETEREYNYEVGGDYEFGLGAGRLKLIGLHRYEHSPFFVRVLFDFDDGRPSTGDKQSRTANETESILRGEYNWKAGGADWQAAAEGAFNRLDNKTELSTLDPSGVFIPVPLPNANAEVKEKRGEIALTYGRPLSSELTLQTSLGAEYSQISQTGPAGLTRTFYRPKGYVSVAWKPSPNLDVSARLEREVGQLDFFDFVASADIGAGNQNAGNPNLVPQQSWNINLEATRDLGDFGSITAKAYVDFIEDIVDQIPVGPFGEAPGNIDHATAYGFEWNSTFKFDRFGWRGAKLDADLVFRKSRLDDPLTGQSRRISLDQVRNIDVEFRHDIPQTDWAYGAVYSEFREARGYRLGELSHFIASPGDLGVFVENKDVLGLKVRGGVYNLLGTNERFKRTIYVNRRDGPILVTEDRSRYFGQVFSFEISGSF